MSSTLTAAKVTCTPPALTAIQLPCPRCGESIANIALNLWTLDDTTADNFTCAECSESFSVDLVREIIARWQPLLKWLESAPQCGE